MALTFDKILGVLLNHKHKAQDIMGVTLNVTVKQGDITGNTNGDLRGEDATDFQLIRTTDDMVAGGERSFIAGGINNKIANFTARGYEASNAFVSGRNCEAYEWDGVAMGAYCLSDAKMGVALANVAIASGNDSVALCNRSVTGRRYFSPVTTGSEDAGGGLGVLQYIIIADAEGDVTNFFPFAGIDNVTTRYNTGAQADTQGNIYSNGFTPAVWDGDTVVAPNDLRWALHCWTLVKGSEEAERGFIKIAKTVYSVGSGTKVYYYGAKPFSSLAGIYTSYAPAVDVLFNGEYVAAGHSQLAAGLLSQSFGFSAVAIGSNCKAWRSGSLALGAYTKASANYAQASGYYSEARGQYSVASGYMTLASGEGAQAINKQTTASGNYSFAAGDSTTAQGICSVAIGNTTKATGENSVAHGYESVALRNNEKAYSVGKRSAVGDDQIIEINYSKNCANAGWHDLFLLDALEDGKSYHFSTMVMGVQYAGSGGAVGNTFAYKFEGVFQRSGSTVTVLGTPIRTLITRSSGMTGDGLTTGPRVAWYGQYSTYYRIILRFDSEADTNYRVQVNSRIQELKFS